MIFSTSELGSSVESLQGSRGTIDPASKCLQIPLKKPKNDLASTKSKDNLFAQYYEVIIEHPDRQIGLSFRIENRSFCIFSITKC